MNTVDDIVNDLVSMLEPEEINYLINPPDPSSNAEDCVAYIRGLSILKCEIRNHYRFWDTHPLTERWRTYGANDLREGVDFSVDHPDNVSAVIVERLLTKLRTLNK